MRYSWTAPLLILVLALAAPAQADLVYTKDGRKFEGDVIREGGKIIIKTKFARVTLDKNEVDRIVKKTTPAKEFKAKFTAAEIEARGTRRYKGEKRKEAVDGATRRFYHLGLWAKDKHLVTDSKSCFRRVIELQPDHVNARRELGQVKHEGAWVAIAIKMRAEGKVLYRGEWMTDDERSSRMERAASSRPKRPAPYVPSGGSGRTWKPCQHCSGEGWLKKKCYQCRGTGKIARGVAVCYKCGGRGIEYITCKPCGRTGKIQIWKR
jgi:hypothetical protein